MYAVRCLDCFDDAARLRLARVIALAAGRAGRSIRDDHVPSLAHDGTGAFPDGQTLDRARIDACIAAEIAPVLGGAADTPRDRVLHLLNWALGIARYTPRRSADMIDDPDAYFDFYHRDHTRTEGRFRTELSTWAEMAVAAAGNVAYEVGLGVSADDTQRAEAAAARERQHQVSDIIAAFPPRLS